MQKEIEEIEEREIMTTEEDIDKNNTAYISMQCYFYKLIKMLYVCTQLFRF